MNVVIISAQAYPANSPRSFRATELAKGFSKFGHNVVLYSIQKEKPSFYEDFSAKTGVVMKNLGKTRFFRNGKIGAMCYKMFNRYFLFPEREIIPMVKKAISDLQSVDLLITIAVPHSIHYAAAKSDLSNVKVWVADSGDPMMGNPFVHFPSYMEKFERKWCERCNYITIPIEQARDAYYPEYRKKIHIIPQGFDFSSITIAKYKKNDIPTFAFAGRFFPELRDPTNFLKYLKQIDTDYRFYVFGPSFRMYESFLDNRIVYRGTLNREELIPELSKCDFLININNTSSVQSPSKLIDYSLTGRPFLSISSAFTKEDEHLFMSYYNGDFSSFQSPINIDDYNIDNIVRKFIDLTVNTL